MNTSSDGMKPDDNIETKEIPRLLEFGCWTAVLLFPVLYYVNGPAVSTDQFVVRTILVVVALGTAVSLRTWDWQENRKKR